MTYQVQKVDKLPVMEAFYTLQGEGFYSGTPAYFIRLGGCDVGCHWCDVKESWEAEKHPSKTVEEIVNEALQYPARRVVVTGGEPLMYDLSALTEALSNAGFQLNLETAGVYPITGEWDWICFSPKKFKTPLAEYYTKCHELKVIIFNQSDFEWAESHSKLLNDSALRFLQTEWSKSEQLLPSIISYIQSNTAWRLSLQTHKYINIP